MGEPGPEVMVLDDLDDDAVITRGADGRVDIFLSRHLYFAQQLFVLRWATTVLDALWAPAPLTMGLRIGAVLGRTGDLAADRFADLMDVANPTVAERLEAFELICG